MAILNAGDRPMLDEGWLKLHEWILQEWTVMEHIARVDTVGVSLRDL